MYMYVYWYLYYEYKVRGKTHCARAHKCGKLEMQSTKIVSEDLH